MARKIEDTDFQFAIPCGVPKRRKVSVKNSDLNGKLSSLSRSSSFSFNAPSSYHDNLDFAFQSVATESSSEKSKPSNSMPRMSSFLMKDSSSLSRGSRSLTKMSAFSGSWTKKKSRNCSKNWKADKFTSNSEGNLLFDKDYHDFITPLVGGDAGDSVNLDDTPLVGDLFDEDEFNGQTVENNKDSVDLDITPPVSDFSFSSDDEDHDDGSKTEEVDLDKTPPVSDFSFSSDDENEDDDSKKEEIDLDQQSPLVDDLFDGEEKGESDNSKKEDIDLDKTPPVDDLFDGENDDIKKEDIDLRKTPPVCDLIDGNDDPEKPDNNRASSSDSSESENLQDITPPVSPSLSFGEDDDVPAFDTWKITNSEGVILKTGDDDVDIPQATLGTTRVFHVLPGDDQVQLTLTI